MKIEGRVALITGGASGLGKALAERLLERGARGVVIADLAKESGDKAVVELRQKYDPKPANVFTTATKSRVYFVETNVTDPKSLQNCFEFALSQYAPIPLSIVANNAGLGGRALIDPSVSSQTSSIPVYDRWRVTLDVCLTAVLHGTQLAVDVARNAPWAAAAVQRGLSSEANKSALAQEYEQYQASHASSDSTNSDKMVVLNVSSMGGLIPMPFDPVYCAAKHGVVGLGRSMIPLRRSLGVRVQTICPSFTNTPLVTENISKGLSDQFTTAVRLVGSTKRAVVSSTTFNPSSQATGDASSNTNSNSNETKSTDKGTASTGTPTAAAAAAAAVNLLPVSLVIDAMEAQITQPRIWSTKVCRITLVDGIDAHVFADEMRSAKPQQQQQRGPLDGKSKL